MNRQHTFRQYHSVIILILVLLQCSVILDFMILSPVGPLLIPSLGLSPSQFAWVVSIYAISAGVSGFITAMFADSFDRKSLLLVFYFGFIAGTLLCGVASSYTLLIFARMFTGFFGGSVGSIILSIVADIFPFEKRGSVMGYLQSATSVSQIFGLPFGMYISNRWGWHTPFLAIVLVAAILFIIMALKMKPINQHLVHQSERNDRGAGAPSSLQFKAKIRILWKTLFNPHYIVAFLTAGLMSASGFMILPFGSVFAVRNVGISPQDLPIVFMITGIVTFFIGPVIGQLSDRFGKYRILLIGVGISLVMIPTFTRLHITPFTIFILINILVWTGVSSVTISGSSLLSAIPPSAQRGAFMSIYSSVQQLLGGIGAGISSLIVIAGSDGKLVHFDVLGTIVASGYLAILMMMTLIHRRICGNLIFQPSN